MEKTENIEQKKKRGGPRPGSGRKHGSTVHITIAGLLDQVQKQSNGQNYEEILIADFLDARDSHNKELLLKYHNLILNKVMNTLAKIEVTDSADSVEAKKTAFAEALAKLAGVEKD